MYMKFNLDINNFEIKDVIGNGDILSLEYIDELIQSIVEKLLNVNNNKGGFILSRENINFSVYYQLEDGNYDILIIDGDINLTNDVDTIYEDALTGLPNKEALIRDLGNIINNKSNSNMSLFLLDIDSFRKINDLIGISNCDKLLKDLVERLFFSLLSNFDLYRFEGDCFAILRTNRNEEKFIRHLDTLLDEPFQVGSKNVYISFSKGSFNLSNLKYDDSVDLVLDKVNLALMDSKERGKGGWTVYSDSIMENTIKEIEMENLIREAIKNDQFHLVYQPQISFKEKRLVGAEALIRWNHPTLGFISPAQFIPRAEKSGLIIQIGEWVLKEVCKKISTWVSEGKECVKIGVNIASSHFKKSTFISDLNELLDHYKIDAKLIGLEITEGSVIDDAEDMVRKLSELKELGVHVSIDDFGTGYSSLSYLKKFKIDTLKIDQSFVMNMPSIREDKEIVRAIVALAKNLNIEVIAEGVETEEAVNLLMYMDCTDMQGYLFSKPMPLADFEHLISGNNTIQNLYN